MDIIIKKAETEEEIKGKAYVHWKSWHEAYPDIVDPSYLTKLTLEKCEEIAFAFPDNLLIAKDHDRIIAFVSYGDCRDEDLSDTGEVYAIYVLEEYYGQGIGSRLMEAAMEELKDRSAIAVWVLKDNEKAIRFYEHQGFHSDGKEVIKKLGSPVAVIRMIRRKEDVL
ncbi:MAG: GNAT family N-acetyltransferase [Erysipelotrichaceae bacterium]|nr:GNAT family N-acetyltransferase [Erysipelotrichaceae bacterium]